MKQFVHAAIQYTVCASHHCNCCVQLRGCNTGTPLHGNSSTAVTHTTAQPPLHSLRSLTHSLPLAMSNTATDPPTLTKAASTGTAVAGTPAVTNTAAAQLSSSGDSVPAMPPPLRKQDTITSKPRTRHNAKHCTNDFCPLNSTSCSISARRPAQHSILSLACCLTGLCRVSMIHCVCPASQLPTLSPMLTQSLQQKKLCTAWMYRVSNRGTNADHSTPQTASTVVMCQLMCSRLPCTSLISSTVAAA